MNINDAIFLAHCCDLTANQYTNNGNFTVPKGFQLIETFKASSLDNTEWFGYIIESNDSIVIAFRCTITIPDWITDVEAYQSPFPYVAKSGKVHHGFLHLYSSCRNKIIKALARRPKEKALYITGHSLGAALAVLHAMDAASNLNFKHVIMVNFGSPRVGDPTFASLYNRKFIENYRIVNIYDTFVSLPPKNLYWLSGNMYHYKHTRGSFPISEQKETTHLNHALTSYIEGLRKLNFFISS